ncbi:hypothetical protein [Segetibacter aerophilus]|uniref:Uncharacterized protein n=1 Tax=Segetibacter aerophilus TaxID=670293 RepID=A0A512BGN3_9BACT|nr:hypothetical protein [Segetibacter aerophilus]GEO11118.1 hypothetical protein SAE01_36140 [Segetibacter aerophilus]
MYLIDDTEASLLIDDFTQNKSIQITKVAGNRLNLFVDTFEFPERDCSIESLRKVSFQFAYHERQFYIRLKGSINKGDTIYFLFENGKVIEKTITKALPFHRAEYAEAVQISVEETKVFATTLLKKWKVTTSRTNTFIIGGFIDNKYLEQYPTSEEGQYLLLLTARQLIKQVIFHYPNLEYQQLLG